MRKVLAILLISLLSLQASWAAAASYCRHEQGAAARHFGHHEHQHGHPWQKSSVQQGALSAGALAGDAGHETAAADGVAAGIEAYSELGKLAHIAPSAEQAHTLYAVMDVERGDWAFNFGIGRGLNPQTDRWTLKGIIEFPFR